MRTRSTVAALAILFAVAAAAAPAPARQERAALTPLEATNRLLAQPWAAFGKQLEIDAEHGIEGFEGKKLAGGGGSVGITYKGVGVTAKWEFGVKARNVLANFDLTSPPGIVAASPTLLAFDAPRTGGWRFGYQAIYETYAWVKVAGTKIWQKTYLWPMAISIQDFRIPARAVLNSSEPDRPRLISATITPTMKLGGSGLFPAVIPVTFRTTVEQGKLTMVADAFSMPIAEFGFANARIEAGLRIVLQPLSANTGDEDIIDFGKNRMKMTVAMTGTLKTSIPYVPSAKESFGIDLFAFKANVPTTPELNDLLHLTKQPTPRSWGEGQTKGWVPEAPANVDYATTAASLEAGIDDHLPYGAILSIDCTTLRPSVRLRCDDYTWAGAEDSAIWTGHYLAAESFRYASGDLAALPRIEKALAGIERLFWVAGDVAISDGARVPVKYQRGLLSRSAMPFRTRRGPPVAQYSEGPVNQRKCYYQRPEGGWKAAGRTYARLALVPKAQRAAAEPVGTVWGGWGCDDDHPVTKDQYTGVFYGLTVANRLVANTGVQSRTRTLIRDALDYLWSTGWNIRVPPKDRIEESFLGDFSKQMAFLRIGASIVGQPYVDRYAELSPANEHAWIPIWFKATEPVIQYYGFNLSHAALTSALLLEDDPVRRAGFTRAHSILWRPVRHHHNAYFALLRVLAQPPAQRAIFAQTKTPWLDPTMTVEKEIRSVLYDWIRRYDAVKTSSGMPASSVGDPTVQAGMLPSELAQYVAFDGSTRRLSVFALPVRGRSGRDKDFVWQRDPFDTAFRGSDATCQTIPPTAAEVARCGSRPNRVHPGVDYLLAYWLGVYVGVLPKPPLP
ncbi:MAG: hypothetical protein ABI717_03730 [Actinomycetota bacterium]